jgi:tight adherence protein C
MEGNFLLYIILALAFGSVFLLALGLYPHKFLQEAQAESGGGSTARAAGGLFIGKLGNLNRPLVSGNFRKKMTQRFVTMGNPHMRAEDFIAYQEISAILFAVLGLLILNAIQKPLIFALIFGVVGFVLPFIWLRDQIKKRHHKIQRALPYSIDLLTLSVEAGLDFQAAIAKVVEKGQKGPLREELSIMLGEIKLGKTREQALRNLADRVRLPPLTAFVSNLIQADRMGTSLGKVLRIQSTQMRIERTQRAEKLANEAPVKMLFPLVICIFPTVFLILFGPIVYRLMG